MPGWWSGEQIAPTVWGGISLTGSHKLRCQDGDWHSDLGVIQIFIYTRALAKTICPESKAYLTKEPTCLHSAFWEPRHHNPLY